MEQNKLILIADKDEASSSAFEAYLKDYRYDVVIVRSVDAFFEHIKHDHPDLIILDINFPEAESYSFIYNVKSKHKIPIMLLGNTDSAMDRVAALEIGADDYAKKPIELPELAARVKANLRLVEMGKDSAAGGKYDHEFDESEQFTLGDWTLDCQKMELLDKNNKPAGLTANEFKLLEYFAHCPNRVLSREHLFNELRGEDFDAFDRTIDIQIGRLRKKLGDTARQPKYIKTVRGVGYMLIAQTSHQKQLHH